MLRGSLAESRNKQSRLGWSGSRLLSLNYSVSYVEGVELRSHQHMHGSRHPDHCIYTNSGTAAFRGSPSSFTQAFQFLFLGIFFNRVFQGYISVDSTSIIPLRAGHGADKGPIQVFTIFGKVGVAIYEGRWDTYLGVNGVFQDHRHSSCTARFFYFLCLSFTTPSAPTHFVSLCGSHISLGTLFFSFSRFIFPPVRFKRKGTATGLIRRNF